MTAPEITPAKAVSHNGWEQVDEAKARLALDPVKVPRLPWDSLHDALGPLWPGELWVAGATSGNGKSTLLMSLCAAWSREGKRVWVLPLEQPAGVMRLHWAAYDLELPNRDVLENALTPANRARVTEHLDWQIRGAGRERVGFSDAKLLTPSGVAVAFDEAQRFGANVLLIDHLNHNGPDEGSRADGYTVLRSICHEILRCNEQVQSVAPGLMTFAAAQLHRDKSGDRLAAYKPPKETAIEGGEVIRQCANVAIGLYRPMREEVTKSEEREVAMGTKPLKDILQPNTIGVSILKHRIRGNVGQQIKLGFHHGRIVCAQTNDREAYEHRHDL